MLGGTPLDTPNPVGTPNRGRLPDRTGAGRGGPHEPASRSGSFESWWARVAGLMTMPSEAVDDECEREQVEELTCMPNRMRSSQPKSVVQGTIDRLSIAATPVELGEVWVTCWNRTHVLCPVELASAVLVGRVQPNSQRSAAQVARKPVVVVPTVHTVLVSVSVGSNTT